MFFPYTFSPLSTSSNFTNLWCTPKQNQAPFLNRKDPQRNPLRHLGRYQPTRQWKNVGKFFSHIYCSWFSSLYVFSPIRSLPYQLCWILHIFDVPQNKTKPLFLSSKDPQRTPFKHLGGYHPTTQLKNVGKVFSHIYCSWFSPLYVFSPIRSLPYQFCPNLQIFNVPQNKTKPLFLVARIPKEHPLRHLGGYHPTRQWKNVWKFFFSYILFLILFPIRFLPWPHFWCVLFCKRLDDPDHP